MLKKCGSFDPEGAPLQLRKEPIGPKTFNDGRNGNLKFLLPIPATCTQILI